MSQSSNSPTPAGAQLPVDVRKSLLRLRVRAWSISAGLLLGLTLFSATLFLVVRGGPDVGAHLNLLGVFLPGYSVTVLGSFIGFVYAFVIGYVLGWIAGKVYNIFAQPV